MRFSASLLLRSGLEDTGPPSRQYRSRQLTTSWQSRCSLWAIRGIPAMWTAMHKEKTQVLWREPIDVMRRCRQEFSGGNCEGEENWSCILTNTLGEYSP